ncbi:MAG: ImmA/IrrE family metallo-endopeptidase [Clostridia bacterium]|nr:ImmA/IrrE family metallo-endopeptidase [Clostridia bacterium]
MTDKAVSAARRVLELTGSRDPFRAARELGIDVLTRDDFVSQKGAFCMVIGCPFIFLNGRLTDEESVTVCAHELGHAMLHRKQAVRGALCEFDLFDMATGMEYEANVFAAEFLIDTADMREYFASGLDVYAAAGALGVNVNLLLIKLAELNRRGGRFNLPYVPEKAFMGE